MVIATRPTREELVDMYLVHKWPCYAIRRKYHVQSEVVHGWLEAAGIEIRPTGKPRRTTHIFLPGSRPVTVKPLNGCAHWWLCAPANGPTSRCECKYCHEVREMANGDPEVRPVNVRDVHQSHGQVRSKNE